MVVLFVREDSTGDRGNLNDRLERAYTRTFTVQCSSVADDSIVVRSALGIPRLYTPYVTLTSADLGSWCRTVDADRVGNSNVWRVVCQYSSKLDQNPAQAQIENPLLRPPVISWDTITVAVPATHDADGNPVRNTAGDPFDPPPEEEETRLYLRVTKNMATYDATGYMEFQDTVNSEAWLVFQPGEARCRKIRGDNRWENGLYYWVVSFEFELRKEVIPKGAQDVSTFQSGNTNAKKSWFKYILNRGYREKVKGSSSAITGSSGVSPFTLTFSGAPDWTTGTVVTAPATGGGLTKDTKYYYRRLTSTTGTLHPTAADAFNNTNPVNGSGATGTTLTSKDRLRPCLDPFTKQPLAQPALLDADGKQLTPGDQPVYLGFRWYAEKNFNQLGIF